MGGREKMKRRISLIIALVLILTVSSLSYGDVMKDETVYVNLNYDGGVSNISVVNRISGTSDEEYFTDYGKYEYIRNLRGDEKPIVEGDKVKWPTSLLKDSDIYYEGGIKKDLPVKIGIKYFLNGSEVNGADLAGKDGDLMIKFSVDKNDIGLATQIQLALDLDLFSDIKVKNGVSSVVGKKMNVVFTHLPISDQVYEVEAHGKNIELDPILISSMPSKFSLPEDINKNIDKFATGMNEMSVAADKLEDGNRQLTDGTKKFKGGISSLSAGIGKISTGYGTIAAKLKKIISGFEAFNQGIFKFKDEGKALSERVNSLNTGLGALSKESENIRGGLQNLNNGMNQLSEGTKGLDNGLKSLSDGHKDMVSLARSLSDNPDPRVKALAAGVISEAEALSKLSSAANQVNVGMSGSTDGFKELYTGYEKYNEGQKAAAEGMNKLNEGIKFLPEELGKMYEGHSQLVEGLKGLEGGVESLNSGLNEVNTNTKTIPNEIDKLVNAEVEIGNGISRLNNEGIKEAEKAITSFGSLTDFEKDGESSFTSFVDNERNKNSTSQFIMKTPGIKVKAAKIAKAQAPQPKEKESFIKRIINLFRR